ncbi:hypothetical protein G6L37_03100 [Agrobacterium rubi]|nr:hypothetical protein [Agrobacterium rubi]NTF24363.1 hypothetical protein [Agrobacterium rubi]
MNKPALKRFRPTILLVGNDDRHEFVRKGFQDKIGGSGLIGAVIGNGSFCDTVKRGDEPGVVVAYVADDDAHTFARQVRSALLYDPDVIAMQSPPDDAEVYRMIEVALHGGYLSLLVIALPSSEISEFFEKADSIVEGLGTSREHVHAIFGTNISTEYWAS